MAWQLIAAAAAPYVAKGIGQALNKPKEEDFKPQTKYMEKYLSHLKGITTNREAQHLAMQPALKTIGAESRKTKQQLGYQAEKTGVSGSGIEAQMKLSAGQGTQEALAQASATAAANQAAINRRTGEQIAEVSSNIEREKERATEAYKQAGKQWKQDNINLALEAGASLAGAGLKMGYENQQAKAYTSSVQGFEGQAAKLAEMGMSPKGIAQEAQKYRNTLIQTSSALADKGIFIDPYNIDMEGMASEAKAQGFNLYYDDPNQTEIPEGTTGEYIDELGLGYSEEGHIPETPEPVAEPVAEPNKLRTYGDVYGENYTSPETQAVIDKRTKALEHLKSKVKVSPHQVAKNEVEPEVNVEQTVEAGEPDVSPYTKKSDQTERDRILAEYQEKKKKQGGNTIENENINKLDSGMSSIEAKEAYKVDPEFKDHIDKNYSTKEKKDGLFKKLFTRKKPKKPTEEFTDDSLGDTGDIDKPIGDIDELSPLKPIPEFGKPPENVKVDNKPTTINSRTDKTRRKSANRRYDNIVKKSKNSYDNYINENPNADINEVTVLSNLARDIKLEFNLKNMTTQSLGNLPDTDKEIFISTSPKLEERIDELVTQYKNKWGEEWNKEKKKYPNWVEVLRSHLREGGKYTNEGTWNEKTEEVEGKGIISNDIISEINYMMGRDSKSAKELNGNFLLYLSFKYDLWR